MHKQRRMLFFAASNFDCSSCYAVTKSRKQLGNDNWVLRPRIDNSGVIAKDFYAHKPARLRPRGPPRRQLLGPDAD